MAIMRLKEAGKLDYDDPITKHIPEWPYEGATVRNLINHTSGIPNHNYLFARYWKPNLSPYDPRRIIEGSDQMIQMFIEHQPEVEFRPGGKYGYSDTGYVLLSVIVERVAGIPFHQYMREQVFLPAGMEKTYVFNPLREDPLTDRAYGITPSLDGSGLTTIDFHYLSPLTGAGGVYSTVEDLYRWDRILYTEQLVSASSLKEAFTPTILNNGDTVDYGFGWSIRKSSSGGKVVAHSGYAVTDGRSLSLDLYSPEEGPGPFPAVLLIHGERPPDRGRDYYRELAAFLAGRRDIVAAVIEYRSAAQAGFPGAIEDARAAVRWIRAHAADYGINPRRIAAAGENFGGYIAAMLSLYPRGGPSTTVQAVAAMSPVVDLATFAPTPDGYSYHYALFLRYPKAQRPDLWHEASPLTYAATATVPFLLVHGTEDRVVPLRQSAALAEALRTARVSADLMEIEGAGNALLDDPQVSRQIMRGMGQFLNRELWEAPPGVVMEPDLVYASPDGRDLRLDLFRPEELGVLHPAIVFVHGGGWLWGNKVDHRATAAYLASRGFVTACIEYRTALERTYPAALNDVKAAVEWLRTNAARYEVDPQRIGAAGSSAGAHLVAMLGLVPEQAPEPSAAVRAVAGIATPVDLVSQYQRDPYCPALFLGAGSPNEHADRWAEASPINHINSRAAEFLFLHSKDDNLVSYAEAVQMAERLRKAGVRAEVFTTEQGGHDFFFHHPWRWPAVRRLEEFFADTLAITSHR